MNPSTALARVLIDELLACGVTEVVLAPGSRNAPLSMALHDADAAGRVRLHVRIDERTAGFLALGLARGSGRPAAVVTTSGTAVANLHPAVLEASHGGVPLIVLSADRPPWLRDVGANQTVDQRGLFGPALRMFHEFGVPRRSAGQQAGWRAMICRAVAVAGGAGGFPGPVQLNIALADPLLPDDQPTDQQLDDWPEPLIGRAGPWTTITGSDDIFGPAIAPTVPGERVLFVADLTHPWASSIAEAGHLVVAESGGAGGAAVLSAGIHLLGIAEFIDAATPERVVVLGRPTLFRQVQQLLGDQRIVVDAVAHPAGYADPVGSTRVVAPGWPDLRELPDPGWAARWRTANRLAGNAINTSLAELDINASPRLARDLVAALPDRATLVLGSSQAPRDVALTAAARDGVRVVANRGVAGIDGTISTAVGVALTADDVPTIALLGDLTFLHDITGLLIGPHEPRPDLTIVVSNNDGGAIFGTLESGRPAHSRAFERVFGTPHGALLAGVVESFGAEHILVSTADELPDALADPSGIRVVEVPTSRTELPTTLARFQEVVRAAL
ncbi:MAG: 2-succinyl-5-enolpyruvyl-6-hydroxy-3-cyclohexene-1-carboxylic-acid synthase [Nakamurella sp.]